MAGQIAMGAGPGTGEHRRIIRLTTLGMSLLSANRVDVHCLLDINVYVGIRASIPHHRFTRKPHQFLCFPMRCVGAYRVFVTTILAIHLIYY